MAYPGNSDWTTGTARDAWYYIRAPGRTTLCSGDGWNLVARLQEEIVHAIQIAGRPLPTVDGSTVAADAVRLNANGPPYQTWDADLLRQLYAAALYARAPQAVLGAIAADAAAMPGTPLSTETLRAAVWIAFLACGATSTGESCGGRPITEIDLPTDRLVPPTIGAPIFPVPSGPYSECVAAPNAPPPTQVVTYDTPSFAINPLLLVLVIAGAGIGAAVLTRRVPTSRSEVARTRKKR